MNKAVLVTAGLSIALVAAPAATAYAAHSAPAKVKLTVSPNKNVKVGATLKITGTGAAKSTSYYCLLTAGKKNSASAKTLYPDTATLKTVKSTSAGKVSCSQKNIHFSGKTGGGTAVSCPPSAAQTKAGYTCGVILVDAATQGKTSGGTAYYTSK